MGLRDKVAEAFASLQIPLLWGADRKVWFRYLGNWGLQTTPTESQKVTYDGSEVDFIEFYETGAQVEPNRVAKVSIGYDVPGNPVTETWLFYDRDDGTTILQTTILLHIFSGVEYVATARSDS